VDNIIGRMPFACWITSARIRTCTGNIEYLSLIYGNNGYANVPQCYVVVRCIYIYRVSQEEGTKLRECVPYVKIYRYNPKHLYPKLNGYGDNGQRSLKL